MLRKKSLPRVAAVSITAACISAGVAGPVHAVDGKAHARNHHVATHKPTRSATSPHAAAKGHRRTADAAGRRADTRHAASTDPRAEKSTSDSGANPPKHDPVTVCHLLGNGSYNVLTFDDSALKAHLGHGDLYPVPAGGCPTSQPSVAAPAARGNARVTVCHLLGNGSYNVLSFDDNALRAHLAHDDLYPVPADGCPADEQVVAGDQAGLAPGTSPGSEGLAPVAGWQAVVGPAKVLGVELGLAPRESANAVLGVQAERSVARTPARVAPAGRAVAHASATRGASLTGVLPQTGAGEIGTTLLGGLGLLAAGSVLLARRRRAARH